MVHVAPKFTRELFPERLGRGAPGDRCGPRDSAFSGPPDAGFALLVVLLSLFVVSLLGTMLLRVGEIDVAVAAHYRSSTAALYLAESALESTIDDFRQDWIINGTQSWFYDWIDRGTWPVASKNPFPDPDGRLINGFELGGAGQYDMDSSDYAGTAYDLGTTTNLGSGSYKRLVWLPPTVSPIGANGSSYRVEMQTRVIGTQPEIAAPAEVTLDARVSVEVRNSSPYNNALMLGRGNWYGRMLAGSVQVAGPFHAIGLSGFSNLNWGTSEQQNNYNGLATETGIGDLQAKVPGLGTLDFDGEVVDSLDATFRLHNNTTMTFGGELGKEDVPGNTVKETIDAVYSDTEISGGAIYADEIAGYDLDPTTSFPRLSDPYLDPDTGISWGSFSGWLNDNSYAVPGGALEIDHNTASFSYSDATGKGSISWDENSQMITIDGIVRVTDIHFGHTANMNEMPTIFYTGTGVIYSTGNARIHKNLYPAGYYLQDGPDDADYEVDGNLGIVVSGSARFSYQNNDPDNPIIIAAIYVGYTTELNNPTNVVGALVTGDLVVNDARLKIWHVPRLGIIYPVGMPPGQPVTEFGGALVDWLQRR